MVSGCSCDTPANNLDFSRANLKVIDQIMQQYDIQRSNLEKFIVSVIITVVKQIIKPNSEERQMKNSDVLIIHKIHPFPS